MVIIYLPYTPTRSIFAIEVVTTDFNIFKCWQLVFDICDYKQVDFSRQVIIRNLFVLFYLWEMSLSIS